MPFLRVRCTTCAKTFSRTTGRINEARKLKWKQYCSKECLAKAHRRAAELICSNPSCAKKTFHRQSDIRKTQRSFCSHKCAAIFNNRVRYKTLSPNYCKNPRCNLLAPRGRSFCSPAHRVNILKFPEKVFRANIIKKLRLFKREHGRIPVKREMYGIYKESCILFGSWNKAVEAAGLRPNPVRFAERQLANDGHACSSIAEKLIDDWLSEHGVRHERNVSYPDGKHTADFFANGTFIEFFGLIGELKEYDAHIRIKKGLARKHHMPLLKVYPKDMYPLAKLNDVLSNALSVPKELLKYE